MRKFIASAILAFSMLGVAVSCISGDDTWEQYEAWYKVNQSWLEEQLARTNEDGTPYYTKVTPSWNKLACVYIKYFNDTTLTRDSLVPYFTSTIDVKYHGRLCSGTAFDSSYLSTDPADSIYRLNGLAGVIDGWKIAFTNMHVGDSAEFIVPYQWAYGTSGSGSIPAYSHLVFDVKLVGIPGLVIPVDSIDYE